MPNKTWNYTWKIFTIILMLYVILGGLLFEVPALPVIHQTIRNIYFHVGMWFSMIFILFVGFLFSLAYLRNFDLKYDRMAYATVKTGLVFGILGIITGMIWAQNTWGTYWVNDPKLNGAAVGILVYLAYLILRASLDDPEKRARLAAVYKIFAFVIMFVFIMILPRISGPSIHPGVDGNPALATGDLDPMMRKVFFPAILGWILFSYWIYTVVERKDKITQKINQLNADQL
ncbi:MAG: cytochrome c biogenesis protein [Bacteroidales bacterium]|nr:cytochrome c biogenesis protein [Bacteroidales bacterium]